MSIQSLHLTRRRVLESKSRRTCRRAGDQHVRPIKAEVTVATDISPYIHDMLSTNLVHDPDQSRAEYGVAATLDDATITMVFTFLRGRTYCCNNWGCHMELHPGHRWDKLRRILTAHDIALPEQLDLSIRTIVEEGAFFETDQPDTKDEDLEYSLPPAASSCDDSFSIEADHEPAMVLQLPDGLSFTLKYHLFDYQFADWELPVCERGSREAHAARGRPLTTATSFRTPEGEWQRRDPLISTSELGHFASWLETVAQGRPSSTRFDFEWPGLEFSVSEAVDALNIHLSRELTPDYGESRTISFPLAQIDLQQGVAALRSQLSRFVNRPMPKGFA